MPSRPGNKRRRKPKKKVLSPWWAVGAFFLVLAAVLLPHLLTPAKPESGAAVPKGYRHFMVDLSHNNPREIRWDSLKVVLDKNGRTVRSLSSAQAVLPLSHVVMKATEGVNHRDRHFALWWEEAGKAGFSRGAYHFFRSSKDPGQQAQQYIGRVTLTHNDLPPILDIETVHSGCTKALLNERALIWLQTVEKHYGRKPIVYTGDSFARDWLSEEITENYPLWIARYHEDPPRTSSWQYWQFTDEAVLSGVPGTVDLSVLR